jgi:hypothetical protein
MKASPCVTFRTISANRLMYVIEIADDSGSAMSLLLAGHAVQLKP